MSAQSTPSTLTRRHFVVGAGAAAGGLALGFHVPTLAQSGAGSVLTEPEVNAWVVVRPDDTCVLRVARAEMGQGTHTGLAQLVAEELECDWDKVIVQTVTPAQNLARQRIWRDMSTGGSRGIRGSQDYMRLGGAAARLPVPVAACATGRSRRLRANYRRLTPSPSCSSTLRTGRLPASRCIVLTPR
ncbi:MAG: twin-arginine translocation signal domain-containing protein [Betaproteobacteria bacterium]|nr:twin-arginine translocation signal domain-containing protein [Betaproteobacteria bacterium]